MEKNVLKIRLGCVPYLNAKPLVYGLESHSDIELVYAVPRDLCQMLRLNKVDAALAFAGRL